MQKAEYIFGIHAVRALLAADDQKIIKIHLQAQRNDQRLSALEAEATARAIPIVRVAKTILNDLSGNQNHQGVVATYIKQEKMGEIDLAQCVQQAKKPRLFLILDGIQDPQNLGACLRSANAFGVQAVILPKDRAARVTPIVRKVASGAETHVPVITVTNLARTLRYLQSEAVWIVGTAADATASLDALDLTTDIALILGNEETGLRRLTREHCDFLGRIPMQGNVDSLNVSVACGISLYEIQRQRAAMTS